MVKELVKTNLIQATPTPLDAQFVGVPTIGYRSLIVRFTDQSTGPTQDLHRQWKWDFGSPNVLNPTEAEQIHSRIQHPTYVYTEPGKYTVKLTVSNDVGDPDYLQKQQYIEVLDNYYGTYNYGSWNGYDSMGCGIFITPSTFLIVAYENDSGHSGVMKSTDYGLTWNFIEVGGEINAMCLSTTGNVIAVGPNGTFISDNNGDTWVDGGELSTATFIYSVDLMSTGTLIAVGIPTTWRSDDGGVTWTLATWEASDAPKTWGSPYGFATVEAADGGLVAFVNGYLPQHWSGGYPLTPIVYKSIDDGATWYHIPDSGYYHPSGNRAAGTLAGLTPYRGCVRSRISKSTTCGDSWESGGTSLVILSLQYTNPFFYAFTNSAVYISLDSMVTWITITIPTPVQITYQKSVISALPGDFLMCGHGSTIGTADWGLFRSPNSTS